MSVAAMKLCFVTVGATAPFEKLLQAVLNSDFLKTLAERQYTHLLVQYGHDGEKIFNDFVNSEMSSHDSEMSFHGITLGGYDFKENIEPDMIKTMERKPDGQKRGLIICHAGAGTVLAGLRRNVPLVVVPNPDLADNHQHELAAVLEGNNYVVNSTVEGLCGAIDKAESQKSEGIRAVTSAKQTPALCFR